MKFFLAKITVFGICLLLIFGILAMIPSTPLRLGYLDGFLQKYEIAMAIKQPKIVVVGGSSVAFGIDSEMMESKLNMPVVNMGLHAQLGLSFPLEQVKEVVKRGDVVLLAPEYLLGKPTKRMLQKISRYYPRANNYYSLTLAEVARSNIEDTHQRVLRKIKESIRNVLTDKEVNIYAEDVFNSHGDMIGHLNEPQTMHPFTKMELEYRYWEGIEKINSFCKIMQDSGVTVYYSFPPYLDAAYNINEKIVAKIYEDLSKGLTIPILDQPKDIVYPRDLFYDTFYHLNQKGKEKRTQALILLLEKQLAADQLL